MYATRILRCTPVVLLLGGTVAGAGRLNIAAPPTRVTDPARNT